MLYLDMVSTRRSSPEYYSWGNMRSRCLNPNADDYRFYGGRGITICDSWSSFENFLRDMGPKPGPKYTLERNDSNGNYEPGNCRWATNTEQNRNKRNNKLTQNEVDQIRISYGQGSISHEKLAEIYGVSTSLVTRIINNKAWRKP
jgi:hypothetical protein